MPHARMGTDRLAGVNFERMRAYRLDQAKKAMDKFGLDCVITWDAYTIRYICSGYPTVPCRYTQAQFVVLPRNGDPHAFLSTSFSCYALREEMPWMNGKIWAQPVGLKSCDTIADLEPHMAKIIPILEEHGLMDGVIGLDGCSREMLFGAALKAKGVKEVRNAETAMFWARRIKNEDEIACMKLAAGSAEAAFDSIQRAIRPGVRECELVGVGMKTLYDLGADEVMEFVCASGPRTNPLHIDYTDRAIRPGDCIAIDINGNSYLGYKSCYYRTFVCGKATQTQKDVFKICRDMMYAAMEGVKAGNTTGDVCNGFPHSPKYWGYDQWLDVSGYAMGHGLGISLHEMPRVFKYFTTRPEHNPEVLEENMVLALETWVGGEDPRYGKFGIRLEEEVRVTKDGYELLTLYPIDEIIECL